MRWHIDISEWCIASFGGKNGNRILQAVPQLFRLYFWDAPPGREKSIKTQQMLNIYVCFAVTVKLHVQQKIRRKISTVEVALLQIFFLRLGELQRPSGPGAVAEWGRWGTVAEDEGHVQNARSCARERISLGRKGLSVRQPVLPPRMWYMLDKPIIRNRKISAIWKNF